MSAVAQRRLGPTSSAMTSTLDRFWPSSVSQERCSRRPVMIARLPFWRVSETFWPSWAQQTTSKNDVCSSHCWVWRFIQRRLTARPNVAMAWPEGVKRSSGSRVTLPMRVTVLSAMGLTS
jgi:hypothetical protein